MVVNNTAIPFCTHSLTVANSLRLHLYVLVMSVFSGVQFTKPVPAGNHVLTITPTSDTKIILAFLLMP